MKKLKKFILPKGKKIPKRAFEKNLFQEDKITSYQYCLSKYLDFNNVKNKKKLDIQKICKL